MRVGDRVHRRLGVPVFGLAVALAVAACGGSGHRSPTTSVASANGPTAATSSRKLGFVPRVNQLCTNLRIDISEIPYPVYAAGQTRYEVRETAVERSGLRSLAAIRAPASDASAYREFRRLLDETVSDGVQARLLAARHELAQEQRRQADAASASRGASIVAGETGLWGCTGGLPPQRFLGRTAAQRVIAKLDQACAPGAEADADTDIDEVVVAAQARAGKLTQQAVRKQIGIDFINAGDSSTYAARSLAHVRVRAESHGTLRDLIAQLRHSGALFLNVGVALERGQPVDLPAIASVIYQATQRAGLEGRALKATYCSAL